MDNAAGFQTVDLRSNPTRIFINLKFFCFVFFSFYLLICFTFCHFPWIFSHKTWYSIYKIRPFRIWMHVFICFSVVHCVTWFFSLRLRSLYSVTLVHGYKLINHLKMSHVTRNPVFGVCDQVIHFILHRASKHSATILGLRVVTSAGQ